MWFSGCLNELVAYTSARVFVDLRVFQLDLISVRAFVFDITGILSGGLAKTAASC